MADRLYILRNLILEINFDIIMGDETKIKEKDKKINIKDGESFKQIAKIGNISYKEPNEEEMKSYWEEFVLSRKVKRDDEVNYNSSIEKELERWRDEFLRAYLGRIGEDIIKRLKSKNLVDNYSNYNLSSKEKSDLIRKIVTRISNIKNIENISDFKSKSDIALKDIKYSLIIIDNELSNRVKCFINNEDMKREKKEGKENLSKFFVNKKLNIEEINKVFQNPKFKKQTNIDIILKLIKSIFKKMYGENVYSIYRIKDNDFEKKNIKVFFITDMAEHKAKNHLVFLVDYIIELKYDDFGITVKDVKIRNVKREDVIRNVKLYVSKNFNKMGVEKESVKKYIRNRFSKYILG